VKNTDKRKVNIIAQLKSHWRPPTWKTTSCRRALRNGSCLFPAGTHNHETDRWYRPQSMQPSTKRLQRRPK